MPTQQVNEFSWKIGGEAGFGIMASGLIFAKTCLRGGLNIFDYSEYPSLIRGGHNTYQAFVSAGPARSWRKTVNILVALNRTTVDQHVEELSSHAAVIYDAADMTFKDFNPKKYKRPDVRWIGLPLGSIALKAGEIFMRNTVAIGASFALLSVDYKFPASVVKQIFKNKPAPVIQANLNLLKAGYQALPKGEADTCAWNMNPLPSADRQMLITGNDALGFGAIQGGCKFYAAYPMTPSSSILAFLAEHGPKYGMLVRHAEDEIGVINETIGAAHAGVRAMCGTAGGGFALMTEAVGLAGMAEVGVVVFEAQRGGPSTGLPTWTEQGDFRQVMHASQGDFLKIVLAPGDTEECYELTQLALNLAEQFQTPVLVMTDKYLAESHASTPIFDSSLPIKRGKIVGVKDLPKDDSFRRYATNVKDGVSPRSLPGMPHGLFLANSDEHDDYGFTSEEPDVRNAQMDKRARKEAAVAELLPPPQLVGSERADVTLVGWGSMKGILLDCADILKARFHVRVNVLNLTVLNPFPASHVKKILTSANISIMVETNQSGQMAGWIKQHTGFDFDHHVRRYDGRPFEAVELAELIHRLIA